MRGSWLIVLALGACATEDFIDDPDDASWADDAKADGASAVNIAATHLDVHLADHTATATIELEKNGNVELEASGLAIAHVHDDRGNRHFTKTASGKLRVANARGALVVDYGFSVQDNADGLLAGGSTVIWPYFCGNLFPCHSQPADGTTFSRRARRPSIRRRSMPRRRRTCWRGRSASTARRRSARRTPARV
jgi:hypothetical protein